MSQTLNSLTAQVLAGQISCGDYAKAVHAFQHGAPADLEAAYTNPMAAAFDADCAARDIDTRLDRTAGDSEEEDTAECGGCGEEISGEDSYWHNDLQENFCMDCAADNSPDDGE